MKAKWLYQHRYWTRLWHIDRETVLRLWSRSNHENRLLDWESVLKDLNKIEIARLLDTNSLWTFADDALWRGMLWRR